MTMPGRAVWMRSLTLLAARSISILAIPAWYSLFLDVTPGCALSSTTRAP